MKNFEKSEKGPYDQVARVLAQLNTEVVGKILRGEDTLDEDLEKITEIAEACRKRALAIIGESEGNDGAILEDEGAAAAGLATITDILKEYESLRDIRNDLIRSFALRTKEILEIQKKPAKKNILNVKKIGATLTPPDKMRKPILPGERLFSKEFKERLAMLQLILLNLGIDPREKNSVTIVVGQISHQMVRDVSYTSVFIPKLRRLVEICNEVGNRSFVWNTENPDDILQYGCLTKEQKDDVILVQPKAGTALVMQRGWESKMQSLLMNEGDQLRAPVGIKTELMKTRKEYRTNDQRINELDKWRREHPEEIPSRETPLGNWLQKARKKLRDGGLTPEQIKRLTAMDIRSAEVRSEITKTTDEWIKELQIWQTENSEEIPSRETPLGNWLQKARYKLRDGGLTPEQVTRVTEMGIKPAEIQAEITKTTDQWIKELQTWQAENQKIFPKPKIPLGKWLSAAKVKMRDGGFTPEQVTQLTEMGVKCAEKKETIPKTTDERIAELRIWQTEHPEEMPNTTTSLGGWLSDARQKLRDGGFTPEQVTQLTGMGIRPAKKIAVIKTVDEWIKRLQTWQTEHVEKMPPHENPLYIWLQKARKKLRDGGLTPEQIKRLTAMDIKPAEVKSEITKTTDEWIEELQIWRTENSEEIPSYKTPLGNWLEKSRRKLRDDGFTPQQEQRLRALGVTEAKRRG